MALASSIYFEKSLSIEKYKYIYAFPPDYAVKDGVTYSDRLPGTAMFTIPFLAYSDFIKDYIPKSVSSKDDYFFISVILLPNLFGTVGLFLFFLFCFNIFNFNYHISIVCTIICGSATMYYLQSIHLYSHIISLVGVAFAVYISILDKNNNNWNTKLYIASAIIGLFTLVELQNILFIIPIYFYLLLENNKSIFSINSYFNSYTIISCSILGFFLITLLTYNYITFGEFFLKSNKYNPYFEEEKTFITALSGNFWEGLDNLFTSFNNTPSYFDWSKGVNNGMPGLLISNPIIILSVLGFIPFYKNRKAEAMLFISLIIISVLIASFHVTTLIRHIFTIHLFLFMPIIFFIGNISNYRKSIRFLLYSIVLLLSILSVIKQIYLNNHYWGRNFDFTHFEYLKHLDIFLFLNLPFVVVFIIFKIFKRFKPFTT